MSDLAYRDAERNYTSEPTWENLALWNAERRRVGQPLFRPETTLQHWLEELIELTDKGLPHHAPPRNCIDGTYHCSKMIIKTHLYPIDLQEKRQVTSDNGCSASNDSNDETNWVDTLEIWLESGILDNIQRTFNLISKAPPLFVQLKAQIQLETVIVYVMCLDIRLRSIKPVKLTCYLNNFISAEEILHFLCNYFQHYYQELLRVGGEDPTFITEESGLYLKLLIESQSPFHNLKILPDSKIIEPSYAKVVKSLIEHLKSGWHISGKKFLSRLDNVLQAQLFEFANIFLSYRNNNLTLTLGWEDQAEETDSEYEDNTEGLEHGSAYEIADQVVEILNEFDHQFWPSKHPAYFAIENTSTTEALEWAVDTYKLIDSDPDTGYLAFEIKVSRPTNPGFWLRVSETLPSH